MKCRICQSEDHFQANCPRRDGGAAGSSSPRFSGLTLPVLDSGQPLELLLVNDESPKPAEHKSHLLGPTKTCTTRHLAASTCR